MRVRGRPACLLLSLWMVFACAPGQPDPPPAPPPPPAAPPPPEPPPPKPVVLPEPPARPIACAHRDPLRQVFWGDLHVHSSLSADAWSFDVRVSPEDAYRYARGAALRLPGPEGSGRELRSARPLDFMAVTDHAEFLGEVALCGTPGSPVYESEGCRSYRSQDGRGSLFMALIVDPAPRRIASICGDGDRHCTRA